MARVIAQQWVLHVDLDQFIAAVEVLRRPELAGLPVIVGGSGDPTQRSVVATASYEARAFGVQSGMPMRLAARKCPESVFLPSDREAYEVASDQVMAVLRTFSKLPLRVEVLGWDEAFLGAATDTPEQLAKEAQRAVFAATGLWCSIGIGDNVLRAKMATDFGKPAGVFMLTATNWFQVMGDRSTDSLWGIGRKTAKRLADLGFSRVDELAAADPLDLGRQVGPTMGPRYVGIARGQGRTEVLDAPMSRDPGAARRPSSKISSTGPWSAQRWKSWRTRSLLTSRRMEGLRSGWVSRCGSSPSTPQPGACRWLRPPVTRGRFPPPPSIWWRPSITTARSGCWACELISRSIGKHSRRIRPAAAPDSAATQSLELCRRSVPGPPANRPRSRGDIISRPVRERTHRADHMDELPDLETISTLLTVVEGRDPVTTGVARFDEDHNVLRSTQAEVLATLTRNLPENYDKDDLRRVLERIEDAIEVNRAVRQEASAREGAGRPQ